MWLYPPLVIMPNCFTTPQPTEPLDSASDDRSKATGNGIGTRIKLTGESGLVQYNHVTTAGVSLVPQISASISAWAVTHESKKLSCAGPAEGFSSAKR